MPFSPIPAGVRLYTYIWGKRDRGLGGGTEREKRKLRQHLIHGRLQVGDSNEEEVVLQKIEERRHQQQQTFPGLTYICVYIDICTHTCHTCTLIHVQAGHIPGGYPQSPLGARPSGRRCRPAGTRSRSSTPSPVVGVVRAGGAGRERARARASTCSERLSRSTS